MGTDNTWRTVVSSNDHIAAIKSNGTLWTWGYNNKGQLGDGTNVGTTYPAQVGADNRWASVSAGGRYNLAIKTDGTLWAWGLNVYGALGDGTNVDRPSPVQVGTDNGWSSVSVGGDSYDRAIGMKSDGTVLTWGYNLYGTLGDGTWGDKNAPVVIGSDNLYRWGTVAAGGNQTLAVKSDGTLWADGLNGNGQLGDGTAASRNASVKVGADNNWAFVSAGIYHTAAIKSNGTLWAWGRNSSGEAGDGTTVDRNAPVQAGLAGGADNWTGVAAGEHHTAAIKSDGTLWTWGNNFFGQLGDGSNVDRSVPAQDGIEHDWKTVAANGKHTVALKSDGTLWAWGLNNYGQLGDGTNVNKNTRVKIGVDNKWTSVAAGYAHTAAIKSDGSLWAWGANSNGQLGDGTQADRNAPVRIGADNDWVRVAAGEAHTAAIKSDGSLWAWGYNVYGELGDGTHTPAYAPKRIGADNNWVYVAAGSLHTAAVKSDGTVWAWGANADGQLGDGTNIDKAGPVKVGDVTPPVVTANPAYGIFSKPLTVTLSSNEPAAIYYSVDGVSTLVYSGPVTVDHSLTLTYYAVDMAGNASIGQYRMFTIDPSLPTVTADPAPGHFQAALPASVSLTASKTIATIYYTTDGSTPTAASAVYSGPIALLGNSATLKFFAVDDADQSGSAQTAVYDLARPATPTEMKAGTGFEAGIMDGATGFQWIAGGDVPWGVESADARTGTYAAQSGAIIDSMTSSMALRAVTADGVISFWHKVDSETNYDFLSFSVDGSVVDQWSGYTGWTQASYRVAAGEHLFQWTYAKDISTSAGADMARVDDIAFAPDDTTPPVFSASPKGGQYAASRYVTLSANEPSTVYYTTDGTTPTTASRSILAGMRILLIAA